jgi:hypothetical protein
MTFYATPATAAAWIVPKAYVQKVGDDGFKKAPVGAGPYRFVSFTPGVELVLEANDRYWRKVPNVKRLVFRVITDEATRVAMLRKGEADYASNLLGPLAEDVKRTPGLRLAVVHIPATFWIDFAAEQWDPKSPWADRRVRLAAALAIDRKGINQAETLGFSKITSSIVPSTFDFYWAPPPYPYDPVQAKKLLTEAGYPNGFEAGDYSVDAAYASLGEAVSNYLRAVGIRTKVRPLEFHGAAIREFRERSNSGIRPRSPRPWASASRHPPDSDTGRSRSRCSSGAARARESEKNLYLEGRIVRDENLAVRDLLLSNRHLIPPELREDAARLVEHYDCWLEEFETKRAKESPSNQDALVFVGPMDCPLPANQRHGCAKQFRMLQRELDGV